MVCEQRLYGMTTCRRSATLQPYREFCLASRPATLILAGLQALDWGQRLPLYCRQDQNHPSKKQAFVLPDLFVFAKACGTTMSAKQQTASSLAGQMS